MTDGKCYYDADEGELDDADRDAIQRATEFLRSKRTPLALTTEPPRTGWRPMSSAPRDAREIVARFAVHKGQQPHAGAKLPDSAVAYWSAESGVWVAWGGARFSDAAFDAWSPLPDTDDPLVKVERLMSPGEIRAVEGGIVDIFAQSMRKHGIHGELKTIGDALDAFEDALKAAKGER